MCCQCVASLHANCLLGSVVSPNQLLLSDAKYDITPVWTAHTVLHALQEVSVSVLQFERAANGGLASSMGQLLQSNLKLRGLHPAHTGALAVHIAKFFLYIRGWLPMPFDSYVEQCKACILEPISLVIWWFVNR